MKARAATSGTAGMAAARGANMAEAGETGAAAHPASGTPAIPRARPAVQASCNTARRAGRKSYVMGAIWGIQPHLQVPGREFRHPGKVTPPHRADGATRFLANVATDRGSNAPSRA